MIKIGSNKYIVPHCAKCPKRETCTRIQAIDDDFGKSKKNDVVYCPFKNKK